MQYTTLKDDFCQSVNGGCSFQIWHIKMLYVVNCRMLLHGLNILNQKLWSSKKQQELELQSQMHPLQAKVTLGIDMVFPNYLVINWIIILQVTQTLGLFLQCFGSPGLHKSWSRFEREWFTEETAACKGRQIFLSLLEFRNILVYVNCPISKKSKFITFDTNVVLWTMYYPCTNIITYSTQRVG